MDQLRPVGTAMIERLGIADDQQHLDIAAGTGEPGLTVAKLAPRGHVVLTDLAAEMLDIAARRANAQGITNFETTVCSADDLPFREAAFDSISVRFGYMFFPDVAKATAEFARVLKPGGRLCSSVWAGPGDNPWTAIAMQAIAAEAVLAPPDRDGPGMFRCAAPGYVSALYEAAGLREVAEWDVGVELVTRSPAHYWEMISEHVSLAAAALQQVGEPARKRIRAHAIAEVSAFEKDGKVRVPGMARCIAGTKQDASGTRQSRRSRSPSSSACPTRTPACAAAAATGSGGPARPSGFSPAWRRRSGGCPRLPARAGHGHRPPHRPARQRPGRPVRARPRAGQGRHHAGSGRIHQAPGHRLRRVAQVRYAARRRPRPCPGRHRPGPDRLARPTCASDHGFRLVTTPTPLQRQALDLLGVSHRLGIA
jgi:SAM-dependent methyltransferase